MLVVGVNQNIRAQPQKKNDQSINRQSALFSIADPRRDAPLLLSVEYETLEGPIHGPDRELASAAPEADAPH